MAYTTSWDGSGGRPRGRAALGQGKKGWSCALIIWPLYAPAALAADWLEAQLLLAPSTLKELLASTYADVVLMFTDWFPFGVNQGGTRGGGGVFSAQHCCCHLWMSWPCRSRKSAVIAVVYVGTAFIQLSYYVQIELFCGPSLTYWISQNATCCSWAWMEQMDLWQMAYNTVLNV